MAGFMRLAPGVALFGFAPGVSSTPCVDIAAAAQGKTEQEAAIAVYSQCRLKRPTAGALLGLEDPERDCHEFARLYELARHYKQQAFSPDEFCSTMQGYAGGFATDGRLADHGACVSEVEEVLASDEVTGSAERACRRIEQKTGKAPVACAQLVASLSEAPRTDLLDATQICDRLVTGSGNGTQGFDEDHFTYSCVQYANNLITNMPKGDQSPSALEAVVDGVLHSCEAHIAAGAQQFCTDYAGLVRQRAARHTLVQFCDGQYRKMQTQKSNPAPVTQAPVATSTATPTTVAPVVSFHAATLTSQQSKCVSYLSGIESLHLPSGEAKNIVQMDCPKRFAASTDTCSEVAQLFDGGKSQEACLKAVPAAPQPTATPEKKADMRAVCEHVVSKVTAVGLDGTALERATVDVCAGEFAALAAAERPPALKVRVGCRFIAKHLVTEEQKGNAVDSKAFCGGLVGSPGAAASKAAKVVTQIVSKAATVGPVVLHEVTRHHTTTNSSMVHKSAPQLRKPIEVPTTTAASVEENTTGHSDLLSSFLDTYDDSAAPDAGQVGSQAANDAPVAVPDVADATTTPSASTAAPAASSQKSGNFLASFLDQYADKSAPTKAPVDADPPAPTAAVSAEKLPEKTSLLQPEAAGQDAQESTNSVDDVLTSFMGSD